VFFPFKQILFQDSGPDGGAVRKYYSPNMRIVSPKKIEKLQPEKRRENFSGLQTFPSLVSTVNLQGFLNFDDFKFTIPCKFTGDTKDRKVLNHKKCSNYDFFSRICRRY
jgi:hypothetical protein